jgi:hypothetical protein
MAVEPSVETDRAFGLTDDKTYSALMMDLLNWAKAEEFDPSVEGFKKALEPTYGTGQTNTSIMVHVSRILLILLNDARFRFRLNESTLCDLLLVPIRHACEATPVSQRDEDKIAVNADQTVAAYVQNLANLIRNSPTRRLSEADFQTKIDPVVLALMRYVKKNGSKDLTVHKLTSILSPCFGHLINDLADMTMIVMKAWNQAIKEPRFRLPQGDAEDKFSEILLAPVSGPFSVLGFSKRYSDLRRVEDFYMAMIMTVLSRFAVAQVDWCIEYFKD